MAEMPLPGGGWHEIALAGASDVTVQNKSVFDCFVWAGDEVPADAFVGGVLIEPRSMTTFSSLGTARLFARLESRFSGLFFGLITVIRS